MAPLGGADKVAIEGFFASRRGGRVLISSVQQQLCTYFVDKGTRLSDLETARPASEHRVARWQAEGAYILDTVI
jgi:hypothetical protein